MEISRGIIYATIIVGPLINNTYMTIRCYFLFRSALKLSEVVHLDSSEKYAVFPNDDSHSLSPDLEEDDLCSSLECGMEVGGVHTESGLQSEENESATPEMWD